MTIRTDQFGNLRGPDESGKSAIKRSEAKGSRVTKAAAVRRDRRARVLLTRDHRSL
jgi:hypothetical protein